MLRIQSTLTHTYTYVYIALYIYIFNYIYTSSYWMIHNIEEAQNIHFHSFPPFRSKRPLTHLFFYPFRIKIFRVVRSPRYEVHGPTVFTGLPLNHQRIQHSCIWPSVHIITTTDHRGENHDRTASIHLYLHKFLHVLLSSTVCLLCASRQGICAYYAIFN